MVAKQAQRLGGTGRSRLGTRLRGSLSWIIWAMVLIVVVLMASRTTQDGRGIAEVELRLLPLAPPKAVRVISVAVELGQPVERGQVVATMDTSALDGEIAASQARLEQLRTEMAEKRWKWSADQLDLARRLSGSEEQTARWLTQARAELASAQAELSTVEAELARQEELVSRQLASADLRRELEQRRAALLELRNGAQQSVRLLEQTAAGNRLRLRQYQTLSQGEQPGQASQAPEVKLGGEGAAGPELPAESMHKEIAAEEQVLEALRQARESYLLRAPEPAVVESIDALPGTLGSPDRPVLTLVATTTDRVMAYIDEHDATRVRLGQHVDLRLRDRSGPTRRGRIVAVAPSISPLPLRFLVSPKYPSYCRRAVVQLEPSTTQEGRPPLLPGQAFDLALTPQVTPLDRPPQTAELAAPAQPAGEPAGGLGRDAPPNRGEP